MCLAVPCQVLRIDKAGTLDATAVVQLGGIQKEVSVAFVPEVKPGEFVLLHAGFALSIVDEDEAQRLLSTLAELDPGGEVSD